MKTRGEGFTRFQPIVKIRIYVFIKIINFVDWPLKFSTRSRKAIAETWQKEIDPQLADVIFFADQGDVKHSDPQFRTVKLKNVIDNEYPPQRKSFSMLAYFHDHLIDKYDWFLRVDDDTVIQWNNLNHFLLQVLNRGSVFSYIFPF